MDKRGIVITCPCCESRLDVDVRSGNIVRWNRATEVDETGKPILKEEDWVDANKRVGSRLDTATDAFEAGLSKEMNREKDLDDLFDKANEKAKRKPDDLG